jgi:hypothetical protein
MPCVVEYALLEQFSVVIRREDGLPFPPPVWWNEKEDGKHEEETTAKTSIDDGNIYWFRK